MLPANPNKLRSGRAHPLPHYRENLEVIPHFPSFTLEPSNHLILNCSAH